MPDPVKTVSQSAWLVAVKLVKLSWLMYARRFLYVLENIVLQVIESASRFEADVSRGVVVIESDCTGPPFDSAFTELSSMDSTRMAQGYASTLGCAPAYLNGNREGPYAVNSEGLSLEQVRDGKGQPLPQQHPRMQVAKYRIDVPVSRPMR